LSKKKKNKTTISGTGQSPTGSLYVVATPIGNLEDITVRAIRVLREVTLIASEDTRHTAKLLSHLGIKARLFSYYKDREVKQADSLAQELLAGKDIALVSDAGTPAVSDPGAILVKKCHDLKIPVVPVPGVSALTAAVSVAGLSATQFTFLGFFPSRSGQRRKLLTSLASSLYPFIFYESPRRLVKCLHDCQEILGERHIFLGRELTKIHEELIRGTISSVICQLEEKEKMRGECVVIIGPAEKNKSPDLADLDSLLAWYRDHGEMSLRDAVKRISADLDLPRSRVYAKALLVWNTD